VRFLMSEVPLSTFADRSGRFYLSRSVHGQPSSGEVAHRGTSPTRKSPTPHDPPMTLGVGKGRVPEGCILLEVTFLCTFLRIAAGASIYLDLSMDRPHVASRLIHPTVQGYLAHKKTPTLLGPP